MELRNDKTGITPTPEFIADQHTGKFVNILPEAYIIKGAKNDRGFDQAYALGNHNQEYVLIDVVELASKDAVQKMIKNGDTVRAILITGDSVMQDAYADLETISKDAGGADIYIHQDSAFKDEFDTKDLSSSDHLLSSFGLEVIDFSIRKKPAVLIYSTRNGGMLFTGDSAQGSKYENYWSTFHREKQEKKEDEFAISKHWSNYGKKFYYLFPRKGKPAVKVDNQTQTEILNKLSRGVS